MVTNGPSVGLVQEIVISDHLTYKWCLSGCPCSLSLLQVEGPFTLSAEIVMDTV